MKLEDRIGEETDSHQMLFKLMEGAAPEIWNGVMELQANLERIRLATKTEAPINVDISLAQIMAVKYLLARKKGLQTQHMHLALQVLGGEPDTVELRSLSGGATARGVVGRGQFTLIRPGQKDQNYPLRTPALPPDHVLTTHGKIISPHAAALAIEESIERHMSGASASVVTITGLSGSGKSTVTKGVGDRLQGHGIGVRIVEGDASIATERGRLREAKDALPGTLPRDLYALTEQTLLVLLYTVVSAGRCIRIRMPRMYMRNQGASVLGEGVLSFPKIKQADHAVLLEGSDASGVVTDLAILEELLGLPSQAEHLVVVLPSDLSSVLGQTGVSIRRAIARNRGGPNDGSPWLGESRWQGPALENAANNAELVVAAK